MLVCLPSKLYTKKNINFSFYLSWLSFVSIRYKELLFVVAYKTYFLITHNLLCFIKFWSLLKMSISTSWIWILDIRFSKQTLESNCFTVRRIFLNLWTGKSKSVILHLKVSKRENFLLAFFALSKPTRVCGLGSGERKINFLSNDPW